MQNEPIIETSLREEAEALHRIIQEEGNRQEMERRVVVWANDLLMAAGENETGQVKLLPLLASEREDRIRRLPHQRIGSGPGNEIIEPQ